MRRNYGDRLILVRPDGYLAYKGLPVARTISTVIWAASG
jgi:hypothetical protein